jgi:segregation and condensation protein B
MTMPPDLDQAIEAVLLVATEPVPVAVLAQLLEQPAEVIGERCAGLAVAYAEQSRGFMLAEVAGGWRYQSHPDMAPYVERYVLDGQGGRLSAAALETLAIVAYKQPISRAQVAAIRGVNVDGVVRTLEQRGYIGEVARDNGPGQAVLFGTTPLFLERLGLASLADLPPVAEFVPEASIVEQLEEGLRGMASPPPSPAHETARTNGDTTTVRSGDQGAESAEADGTAGPGEEPEAVNPEAGNPVEAEPSEPTADDLGDGGETAGSDNPDSNGPGLPS